MAISTHQCPNCGGALEFVPQAGECKCEYCLCSFSVEELEKKKQAEEVEEMVEETDASDYSGDTNIYSCPSCGAEVVTDKVTSAAACLYCHNPVILTSQLQAEFRPSFVIPFKLDKNSATDALKKWCKKKKFLPRDFLSETQLELLQGIYMPYWLTDSEVYASMTAQCSIIDTWEDSKNRYVKTDKYSVRREGDMSFAGIPHDGSKKADDKVMESIEPFDYNDLKPFSMSYLSGFLAEKYDVGKEEILPVIKSRIESVAKSTLWNSITGYDRVNETSWGIKFKRIKTDYVLLPVWIATYIYKGQTYLYAINGQTGKMFGILPVSKKKLGVLFGALTLGILLLTFILGGTIFYDSIYY